jgi:hypothetical protein
MRARPFGGFAVGRLGDTNQTPRRRAVRGTPVGLFRRDEKSNGDGSVDRVPDDAAPVDLMRFERLVQNSLKLRELGVPYEAIERRASRDLVTFNEALEALYREHVHG